MTARTRAVSRHWKQPDTTRCFQVHSCACCSNNQKAVAASSLLPSGCLKLALWFPDDMCTLCGHACSLLSWALPAAWSYRPHPMLASATRSAVADSRCLFPAPATHTQPRSTGLQQRSCSMLAKQIMQSTARCRVWCLASPTKKHPNSTSTRRKQTQPVISDAAPSA